MLKYSIAINGNVYEVTLLKKEGSHISFELDGQNYNVDLQPYVPNMIQGAGVPLVPTQGPPKESKAPSQNANEVCAPMPGIIVTTNVEVGQEVSAGDVLLVIEAMKMENNIQSPRNGKIKNLLVKAGDEVDNHQLLVEFE